MFRRRSKMHLQKEKNYTKSWISPSPMEEKRPWTARYW
nr:MAG TPA: hypothetical protein [Caudoviricetes sp.]